MASSGQPTYAAPQTAELGFIDAATGNLHIEIPLGSYPQRGGSQPQVARLVYDSNIWTTTSASPTWVPAQGGWSTYPIDYGVNAPISGLLYWSTSQCQATYFWSDSVTVGTKHYFANVGVNPNVSGCPSSGSALAADASGYRMYVTLTSGAPNGVTIQVYAPDGTLVHQNPPKADPSNGSGTYIFAEDSNGNYTTNVASGGFLDTVGRPMYRSGNFIYVPTSQSSPLTLDQMQNMAQYAVNFTTITLKTHFGQSGVTECTTSCTVSVLQSLTLPDNTTYTFKYDCDSTTGNPACGSNAGQTAYYGTLIRAYLPTGATIYYTYQVFQNAYGSKQLWLNSKYGTDGSISYNPSVVSTCSSGQVGCQQQTQFIRNDGSSRVYTFTINNGAWLTTAKYYDSNGTLLRTVNNGYDFSVACPLYQCFGAGYIRKTSETSTELVAGGSSVTKQTTFGYDSPQQGNVTSVKQWKYQPGAAPTFSSTPDRATYISYLTTGTNNINRPLSVTTCNNSGSDAANCPGGGSRVSQTVYQYDSYGGGLSLISGAQNHDDGSFGTAVTARGNPTAIQQWVSGSTFLSTQLSYDTTGQVTQSLDSKNNSTQYSYADQFYADGASAFAVSVPKPTNAYPTTVTYPGLGSKTVAYYLGSGKTAKVTDFNAQSTWFHFRDGRDRYTESDYPIGWELAQYTSANQTDTYLPVGDTAASPSCSSCQHRRTVLDSYGREASRYLVNDPLGQVEIDTSYDPNSRVSFVSHPHVGSSDPNNVSERYLYDGLDRKTAVVHPDNQSLRAFYGPLVNGPGGGGGLSSQQGSPSTYGYGYPAVFVDEAGKPKQEWFDGFGRIIEVDEPTTSATPGTGSVSISGSERSTTYCPCPNGCSVNKSCLQTIYDSGTVKITVNGHADSVTYGQYSTPSSLATALASAINADSAAVVTAGAIGSTVYLTSKTTGGATNYSLSASSATGSTAYFSGTSFPVSASGSALTGGSNNGASLATPMVTLYTYDAADHLTQVIQGVQTRTFTYDGLGRTTQEVTPEGGTITYSFTNGGTLCSGDPNNVCQKIAPAPNQTNPSVTVTTTYCYDGFNRITSKAYSAQSCPISSPAVTYQHDQGGASAYALGRLTTLTDSTGSEQYVYDQVGRTTQVKKTIGGVTYTTSYQYNTGDEATQVTYPSGRVVTRGHDNVGQLSGVSSGSTNYTNNLSWDAVGNLLGFTYGNGVTASYTYSPARLQLSTLGYSKGSTSLFSLKYFYQLDATNCANGTSSDNGQIECVQDLTGTQQAGRSASYTYDAVNRISSAVTTGSTSYPKWGLSWSFDQYGNRLNQTQTAGSPPYSSLAFGTIPAPPANPPGGAYTNRPDGYSFDAAGNMLADGLNSFTYDNENRLITQSNLTFGTSSTYYYDDHGNRIEKTVNGASTVYIFAGGGDIAEYVAGAAVGSPSTEYIYSAGRLVATLVGGSSPSTVYHHSDHLSVRATTDSNGNLAGEQGHYPYGEQWYASNATTKFIFTTYERDSESGNDYAMARLYISRFGRFSCVDPLMGNPSDPQSWNRYAYVRNNPVNMVDPSGQGWLSWLVRAVFALLSYLFPPGAPLFAVGGLATPPIIDNGPFSDTTATLNSIYHPIDPSKFGISEAGGFGGVSANGGDSGGESPDIGGEQDPGGAQEPGGGWAQRVPQITGLARAKLMLNQRCKEFVGKLANALYVGPFQNAADIIGQRLLQARFSLSGDPNATWPTALATTGQGTYSATVYPAGAALSNNELAVVWIHEAFHMGPGAADDIKMWQATIPNFNISMPHDNEGIARASRSWGQKLRENCL